MKDPGYAKTEITTYIFAVEDMLRRYEEQQFLESVSPDSNRDDQQPRVKHTSTMYADAIEKVKV